MNASPVHVALLGSGGAGIATAGDLLLDGARRAGLRGTLRRSFGPQIRGGETASLLTLGRELSVLPPASYDLVFALDWNNAERFASEMPLGAQTVVATLDGAGDAPGCFPAPALRLPLRATARSAGVRENLLMLGVLARWLGLPRQALLDAIGGRLGTDAARQTGAALDDLDIPPLGIDLALPIPDAPGDLWSITGNEATGLGLLRGGVRAAAAYPITPATDLLEWLAPRLERLGGHLVQAEDELASIGMAIGSSFGGTPTMTATSGPGLSLMQEGIGLAVAAEIPLVIVNVQRGGPSTGLPTKSEQSDLLASLFGAHGDAPHVVLAPTSVLDCAGTAEWAVGLAEHLQTPVIIQSEQALAQTRVICDPLPPRPSGLGRQRPSSEDLPYRRYADTPSGIAPMSVPGDPDYRYVADGLEHMADGTPTTAAVTHQEQTARRRRKLADFDFADAWAESHGPEPARCVLIASGSLVASAVAAAQALTARGIPTRALGIRLLAPEQPHRLARALAGAEGVVVVDQSGGAQLYRYLRGWWGLPATARALARPGPVPLSPAEIEGAADLALREVA